MFQFRLKLASAFFDNPEFIYRRGTLRKTELRKRTKKHAVRNIVFSKLNRSKVYWNESGERLERDSDPTNTM